MNSESSNSESSKKKFYWVIVVVLVIASIALLLNILNLKQELNVVKKHDESLTKETDNLKMFLNRLLKPQSNLSVKEIEELKKKGLKYPIADIIIDLSNHKELIPYKGVLGGTMGFYDLKNIRILSPDRIKAYFEDGHINGNILLEYQVSGGKISWKVISSYLSE